MSTSFWGKDILVGDLFGSEGRTASLLSEGGLVADIVAHDGLLQGITGDDSLLRGGGIGGEDVFLDDVTEGVSNGNGNLLYSAVGEDGILGNFTEGDNLVGDHSDGLLDGDTGALDNLLGNLTEDDAGVLDD